MSDRELARKQGFIIRPGVNDSASTLKARRDAALAAEKAKKDRIKEAKARKADKKTIKWAKRQRAEAAARVERTPARKVIKCKCGGYRTEGSYHSCETARQRQSSAMSATLARRGPTGKLLPPKKDRFKLW